MKNFNEFEDLIRESENFKLSLPKVSANDPADHNYENKRNDEIKDLLIDVVRQYHEWLNN